MVASHWIREPVLTLVEELPLDDSQHRLPRPSSGLRGMLDGLVQGSLVELFQAYGVALAPLPRAVPSGPRGSEITACIGFTRAPDSTGPAVSGKLTLAVPSELLAHMTQSGGPASAREGDWTRELVNQLMGRLKNRLLAFGVLLQAGLPSSLGREAFDAYLERTSGLRIYSARTLRADIVVTLEGTLNDSDLSYRGTTTVASEGDLILF